MSSLVGEWKAGRVLRLNLLDKVNQEFSRKLGVERTPTFILFDPTGNEDRRWVGTAPTVADLDPA